MIQSIRRLFAKPELWLVRCVLVASTIAVIYYSADKAKDKPTQAILICLGLAAVGFHYIGAKKACAAWFDRSLGRVFAWSLIICGAVLWEVNGQLGVGSQNQQNLTNAAATSHMASTMAQSRVAQAERKLATLTSEQAYKADVKPASSYDADIASAKAHRFFTITNNCTETKGPQTRSHCDALRAAESNKALAIRKASMASLVADAERELAEARSALASAGVIGASDRADFKNLKRLTSMSADDLELGQSLLMVLVMALFLTVAGWLVKAEEYEGKPRKPWIDWAYWSAKINGPENRRKEDKTPEAQPATPATVASNPIERQTIVLKEKSGDDVWQAIHNALNQPKRIAA